MTVAPAVEHQNKLGWFAFVTGRVSVHWTRLQTAHCAQQKILKPARRWTTDLMKQSFLIAWDSWKDQNDIKFSEETAAAKQVSAALDAEIDALQ